MSRRRRFPRHPLRRQRRCSVSAVASALAGCASLAACGNATLSDPPRLTVAPASVTAAPTAPQCTDDQAALDPTRSYEPDGPLPRPDDLPEGSSMAEIRERGRLVVGVSADTLLFGARNSLTGDIEGFDISVLIEVAEAIFGEGGADNIEFRVITYADRLPRLERPVDEGGVDVVAHTMTINCNRWLRIAFSSTYYEAGQKVLVKKGSGFTDVLSLADRGATVCAPAGSTNLDEISLPEYTDRGLIVLAAPDLTDCLVAMQDGKADAATGDDTVLAGFAAQDPTTVVVGDPFTAEPYGLGVSADRVDLVKFINALLEEMRDDGRWGAIYQRWLLDTGAFTGSVPQPPAAVYGREEQ
jgi:polar amino acid transport system substrate-binding protein